MTTERQAFTINVEMEERWVPHFLGFLQQMERFGQVGSSRLMSFYADGDGDFRPKFEWDTAIEPVGPSVGDLTWDAG